MRRAAESRGRLLTAVVAATSVLVLASCTGAENAAGAELFTKMPAAETDEQSMIPWVFEGVCQGIELLAQRVRKIHGDETPEGRPDR